MRVHAPPNCLWCGDTVARRGDTCNELCYANICSVLARGTPYLRDGDDPPNDLYRQPWAREQGSEDEV